jgi:hypothetical protein
MVVSSTTCGHYLAMTFRCMCIFSLSWKTVYCACSFPIPFLPSLYPLYTFISFHTFSCISFHPIYLPILSLFLSPFLPPSPLSQNSSLTPIFISFTLFNFHLLSYYLQYFLSIPFVCLSYHFPFPFPSSLSLC